MGCPFVTRCPVAQETCKTERPQLVETSPGYHIRCPVRVNT